MSSLDIPLRDPVVGDEIVPATMKITAAACGPQLQAVLDSFPFYVMLVDSEHTILLANEAVQNALDVDPTAIIGGYCPTVVHGTAGPYPGCPLEQANEHGGRQVECEMCGAEAGSILVSGIYPTAFETSEGNRVFLHTTRDVSEQRTAEHELKRSYEIQSAINELLRISLEPLPLDDVLGRILDLIASIPWLEFAPEGAIFLAEEGGNALELKAHRGLDEATRSRCSRVDFGTCFCGRAARDGEIQIVDSEQTLHQIDIPGHQHHGHYCVPIEQSDRVLGVLNVYLKEGHKRDPSETTFLTAVANVLAGIIQRNRAVERQLAHERIAVSRERMARLGEIAAGVAHTVRNPLHGVLNCVDILEARIKSDDPEVIETLSLMREGFERIEKVTRRLLSFTRDRATQPHPTSVTDLLADVERLMSSVATGKGVIVRSDVPDDDPEVALDADRVAEALYNVVGNAIDACSENDTITIRARLNAGALTIEVADSGEGIRAEDQGQVLDPFFTTKPLGEGSGLGLAIARRIMDEHNGRIAVDSKLGVGTSVRLHFPPPAP